LIFGALLNMSVSLLIAGHCVGLFGKARPGDGVAVRRRGIPVA